MEKEYLKRLHSIKGRKAINLIHTKRQFILVVKLIANKCLLEYILLFIFFIHNLRLLLLASQSSYIVIIL